MPGNSRQLKVLYKNVTARMNLLQKNGGVVSGVKTGYKELDKINIRLSAG